MNRAGKNAVKTLGFLLIAALLLHAGWQARTHNALEGLRERIVSVISWIA